MASLFVWGMRRKEHFAVFRSPLRLYSPSIKGANVLNGLPPELNFQGTSRCLRHLAPFTHRLAGHGFAGADLVIRVTFQSHVFSKSDGTGPHDFVDVSGNKRYFCPDRYAFSLHLEPKVRAILELNSYTWETRDKNQVANLAVLAQTAAPLTSGTHDVLIYYLYKSSVSGLDVEMIVKSCYTKEIDFKRHPKRERIRACVKKVCFNGGRFPK